MQQKHVKKISSSGKLTSWLFTKRRGVECWRNLHFHDVLHSLEKPVRKLIHFISLHVSENNKAFINTRVAKN